VSIARSHQQAFFRGTTVSSVIIVLALASPARLAGAGEQGAEAR
jgi:hypothetical protein